MKKLWGKNPSTGEHGFTFSHVKTIYYDWKNKILLKDKLDSIDDNIDTIDKNIESMKNDIPILINNGTTSASGEGALDAAYGKVLRDDIDNINKNVISGYLNLTVKGTKMTGMVKELQFTNGEASIPASEVIGYVPKHAMAICQTNIIDSSIICPSMGYSDGNFKCYLINKQNFTGKLWITALLIVTKE